SDSISGLTISDLNKYLPALQTIEDLSMTRDNLKEGLFWTEGLIGIQSLPSSSIDLIITEPPKEPWLSLENRGSQLTLQQYYNWNQKWIKEANRVLKNTGGIYLLCDWNHSNMYNGLLKEQFIIQNRITWHNRSAKNNNQNLTWKNQSGDIWFATKNEDFLFNQNANSLKSERDSLLSDREKKSQTNFWFDIPVAVNNNARYADKLYSKILDASSFKLNWILDPFMRSGDVGVSSKKTGRRFIGFEANKDLLLMSMKRIDRHNER
ncbi:MAG: DNA-methyltransferase, partial [Candidatus Neomarinimicrobiota bacterium]